MSALGTAARGANILSRFHSTGAGISPGSGDFDWYAYEHSSGTSSAGTVVNPDPAWVPNTSAARWLSEWFYSATPSRPYPRAAGRFEWTNGFDVSGYLRKTVVITGVVSTDDGGRGIYLNGSLAASPASGYSGTSAFTISGASRPWNMGYNQLRFDLDNAGGISGIRVQYTAASATPIPTASATVSGTSTLVFNEGTWNAASFSVSGQTSDSNHPWNVTGRSSTFISAPGAWSYDTTSSSAADWYHQFLYADEGTYSATTFGTANLALATDSIYTASANFSRTLSITVLNVAPRIIGISGDTSVAAGEMFTFATGATDQGFLDTLSYNWDLDGDGEFDDFTGPNGQWHFDAPGIFFPTVQVSDGDGGFDTRSFQVTVVPEPAVATTIIPLAVAVMLRRRRRR